MLKNFENWLLENKYSALTSSDYMGRIERLCRKEEFTLAHLVENISSITQVQKLAYFFYFMAETKKFTNIKPFTLDLSKPFRDKYSNLTYKKLKAVIIKKIYGKLFLSINVSYNQYLVKTQA